VQLQAKSKEKLGASLGLLYAYSKI